MNEVSTSVNFHIRWESGTLDWERHNTLADAEESAKRLAAGDEAYTIEECYETGGMCARGAVAGGENSYGHRL